MFFILEFHKLARLPVNDLRVFRRLLLEKEDKTEVEIGNWNWNEDQIEDPTLFKFKLNDKIIKKEKCENLLDLDSFKKIIEYGSENLNFKSEQMGLINVNHQDPEEIQHFIKILQFIETKELLEKVFN
jgi:hypothetical protein